LLADYFNFCYKSSWRLRLA